LGYGNQAMTATFKLNSDELNESFLEKLRQMFGKKNIEVVVYESDVDETELIRANPRLHARLMESVERVDHREGLVSVDVDSLE
jgi:UDP-glucose 6-dehydrogenase